LLVAAAGGCHNSTQPTPLNCAVGLSLKSALTSGGGTGTVVVSAQSGCAWQATSQASWITGLTPSTGQGNGEVNFQVSANPDTAARQGGIVLSGVGLSVTQPGASCPITISPGSQDVLTAGGTGTIAVSAAADCGWTSSSPATWITVTSGANGTGNGTVGFTVGVNSGPARNAPIAIGGQTFMVNQADVNAPVCQFTILPATASVSPPGGTVPVTIQAGATCSWTATSHADWLTFDEADSGTASGSVMINVALNPGAPRTGTLTIAGQTFTVVQGGS
jgi:hypothetical protein